jgi:hypothetical protein
MKNNIISIINYSSYFMLATSVIVFFGGMIIYGGKFASVFNGFLAGYSVLAFAIGMVILISRWTSIMLGLGLLIFFILLGGCIWLSMKYSGQDNIPSRLAGFGLPLSVFFLVGWMIWFSTGADHFRNKKLLESGISSPAVILNFNRTGVAMKVNADYPRYKVKFLLEVHPKNGASFQAKSDAMLAEHEITALKNGMRITVKYNPKDRKMVAIESL